MLLVQVMASSHRAWPLVLVLADLMAGCNYDWTVPDRRAADAGSEAGVVNSDAESAADDAAPDGTPSRPCAAGCGAHATCNASSQVCVCDAGYVERSSQCQLDPCSQLEPCSAPLICKAT